MLVKVKKKKKKDRRGMECRNACSLISCNNDSEEKGHEKVNETILNSNTVLLTFIRMPVISREEQINNAVE